jgi:signal transduction histidine kinase
VWTDTLFKRLFILMWVGLVASHLLAFKITMSVQAPPGAGPQSAPTLPVLPSLPPMGDAAPEPRPGAPAPPPGTGLRDGPPPGIGPRDGPPPGYGPRDGPPPDDLRGGPPGPSPGGGLPAAALWLDYLVRFAAIGVVAWFGARWLSAPMRRLAAASETLGRALGQGRATAPLDERRGTLEVRQTAQVFNAMAQRLHAQFDAQALLMAAISHDLRTPLARLRLRLEAIEALPQAQRCINDVHEMDALIGSVLAMLRDDQAGGERERIDVTALVQSLVDDLAEQGQPARVAETPDAPAIALAQPAALTRILTNLVGNALRHGGSARVSVAAAPGEWRVLVDDDGPGIAADQLEAVFAPFYRVDAARGRHAGASAGSGLGLYIARDLAQRNGGRLSLCNRAEGGLRAELVVPMA